MLIPFLIIDHDVYLKIYKKNEKMNPKHLPPKIYRSMLLATDIYRDVAVTVEVYPTYLKRASLCKWDKILVRTKLYFKTALRFTFTALSMTYLN